MPAAPSNTTRNFVLLAAGLLILLTWFLGGRGLNEPDEGRYSNIALNFLKPGADLWEPRMSGYGHYDKPPLIYWTTALSFKVFGQNETAARLPSLLGALLTLTGLGWTATRLYGKQVAWWAILICGTFGQFWVLARVLTPDMLLTGWCTLAIGAWAESRHRKGDLRFWLLSLLFWILAWWTKATPALIPLLGLAIGLLAVRDTEGKRALRPMFLLLGMLVFGSYWYLRMIRDHNELVDFFFVREMKGRVTGHVEGRKGPIYYYVGYSFLFWLPWWPLVLRGIIARWKVSRPRIGDLVLKLGVEGWIVIVGILIFSLISSKLPAYTLPMAPWAALLFARCIINGKTLITRAEFLRWAILSGGKFAALVVAAVLVVPHYESRLRVNSSMREVAQVVKTNGGSAVYMDRYWPGMEFYFGSKTFYVVPNDTLFRAKFRQRSDDDGIDPAIGESHFYFPKTWSESLAKNARENIWLVHYAMQSPSPFDRFLGGTNVLQTIKVGDFVLVQIPSTASAAIP